MEAAGLASNVNYGEAAIMTSIAELDEVGVAHPALAPTGTCSPPGILTQDGVRHKMAPYQPA